MKIEFLCHGNICRSPMAEFVFKHLADEAGCADRFEVSSAAVSYEEEGNPMYPPAKRKLTEKGIPFDHHRAHRITLQEYRDADLVIINESNLRLLERITGERNASKVQLLMAFAGQHRQVADPWYTGDFEKAYQDILLGCKALLEHLAANG